ncbi:hypothetical protein MLI38_026380, partial [Escherichia coli]|nr:hypothetical protein [Escherichia coli]
TFRMWLCGNHTRHMFLAIKGPTVRLTNKKLRRNRGSGSVAAKSTQLKDGVNDDNVNISLP